MGRRDFEHFLGFGGEVEKMLDSILNLSALNSFAKEARGFSLDYAEDEKNYYVEADLPGIEKENLNIEVKDDTLILTAHRKYDEEKKSRKYYKMERNYGSFTRTVMIPLDADSDKIDAEFKNGVLKITIPKREKPQENTRKIEVRC